jgi:hypothetical protein
MARSTKPAAAPAGGVTVDIAARHERLTARGGMPISGGNGTIEKWDTIGMEIEGKLCGLRQGPNGMLLDLQVKDELRTFGCPKVLENTLATVARGTLLNICYTSEKPATRAGRSATKLFDVVAL